MQKPNPSLGGLSSLKLALMAKQARAQLGAIARAEPIAIIGMGCRLPGGADSPSAFWSLLRRGVDAVTEVPRERWDVDALYNPDPAEPGKIAAKCGGFLAHVGDFDAPFFGILGREAERMDPQQRLFLEVAIEALDHAGLSREQLAGSNTGAFVASYYNDYTLMQLADRDWIDGRTLTGTQHSVLVNRLSYLLDLRGPSVSVDTACSSSLVAVHLACQSLRSGDSDTALAGGVSLILAPEMMITLSKVGFMSPTGRCRTFDARADGFIRGEGCGVVVLKRLSDAITDNDRVLAVIRGSAVNQDGRSTVLAAPNGLAQQALLRDALSNAQLTPQRVGFVEAHGTATPLGDPIEVEALAAVIGAPRADGSACYLGSAKANLGHLEAASGVTGLIKATLVLQHAEIPGQVHFEKLNPHLSLAGTCLKVADRMRPWPAGPEPRVAGVSGFGVGGTNAHVLLEEAPALAATEQPSEGAQLLALSAQSPTALRALVESWLSFLPTTAEPLANLAATAGARRSHYDQRLALVARSKPELEAQLRSFLNADLGPAVVAGQRPQRGAPRIAFVFSGQGSQWAQMTCELAAGEPVFRDTLADLDARFQRLAGWSLQAALNEPAASSRLGDTELAQPAIFAVQVALAALWQAWGVRPDAVVGHSIGELAALYVAGVLTLDDAVRVVWQRGRIMQRATGLGRMASVALTRAEAEALLREIGPELSIAAVNAPRSVVLSGTESALAAALSVLGARGVSHRALPVTYAFHSSQMQPFQAELVAAIGELNVQPGRVAVFSTVTGAEIEHTEIDAAYFGRNVRQTVHFAGALHALLATRVDAFVELAPHPVLSASIAECAQARALEIPVLASMRRERPARETLLQALAGVYAVGGSPNWRALTPASAPPVDLPAYPWQRQRYWLRPRPTQVATSAPGLLGTRQSNAGGSVVFHARWPAADVAWLVDHEVGGRAVMPAVALLEALRRAAQEVGGLSAAALADFLVHEAFALDGASGWTIVVAEENEAPRLELWSVSEGAADRLIASARASAPHAPETRGLALEDRVWQAHPDLLYERFAELGVRFGPAFRALERFRAGSLCAEAWLALDALENDRQVGLLDGALQLCLVALSGAAPSALLLPIGVESYVLYRPLPARVRAEVRVASQGVGSSLAATVSLFNEQGTLLATLDGVRFAVADAAALADAGPYEIEWQQIAPLPPVSPGAAHGAWLVLGEQRACRPALLSGLASAGGKCRQVSEAAAFRASLAAESGLPVRGVLHLGDVESALGLAQAMAQGSLPSVPLWFITEGAQPATGSVGNPEQAALWGLANVIAAEYPELPCHVVDVEPSFDVTGALLAELTRTQAGEPRCALRASGRYVPRLARRRAVPDVLREPSKLVVARSGTLDGLSWQPAKAAAPGPGEVRLQVLAAGVNFRDVLITLGMYPGEGALLGAECAGVVSDVGHGVSAFALGDRVFGFAPGSMASEVTVPAHFLTRLPAGLRLEDAAALPAAFLTSLYGLQELAQLQPGSSVLIHAGAGGVGQAAIQIARRRGCRVFATAGSSAKRDLLRALGVDAVFDSRSLAFADDVLLATQGKGVDTLLNSLSGEFIPAGLRALASGGWFLELGKRDVWSPEQVASVRPDVRYRVYDLGSELHADATLAPRLLTELCAALADGSFRPLPVRILGFAQVSEAFRSMAQAAHVGKLVLRAPLTPSQAKPAALIQPEGSYWITGGAGALGLHTARWLVSSGAKHVLLTGRSAPSPEARALIAECAAQGARVEFRAADAGDAQAMMRVRDELVASWPALRGVVHAAGIVDDGLLASQTWPCFRTVLDSKASGARILDELTRELALDFFVLFGSAGWLLGPLGQGAYAAANAELDALACARRGSGRPALSVGWGQWREGGMAARLRESGHDSWSARGLGWLGAAEAFTHLERLLREQVTHALVLPIDWSRFLARLPAGVDAEFFRCVQPKARRAPEPAAARDASLVERWKKAPLAERRGLLLAHLHERARHVLGSGDQVLDEHGALKDAGLDSLMAVELRNVLTRSLGTSLPATLLFDYPSLAALAGYLADLLQLAPASVAAASQSPSESVTRVAALSDEEAEAQLLAELDAGVVAAR